MLNFFHRGSSATMHQGEPGSRYVQKVFRFTKPLNAKQCINLSFATRAVSVYAINL